MLSIPPPESLAALPVILLRSTLTLPELVLIPPPSPVVAVLPLIMLPVIVKSPRKLKIPPPSPLAVLPLIAISVTVNVSQLRIAPPASLVCPPVRVSPAMETVLCDALLLSSILKIRDRLSASMVSRSAPGPVIVTSPVIASSVPARVIVSAIASLKLVPPSAEPSPNVIVSAPGFALASSKASRRLRLPAE